MSKQSSNGERPIIIPGNARSALAQVLRDILGEPPSQKLHVPESVRRERQKAAERRERARKILLGVFACFAFIAAFMYLRFLQPPQCTPLQNVSGSSIYVFACYPRALGIGDEGQVKITVMNAGPGELVDVRVFLVCPRQLQVGVEVNGSNMIQFGDLGDGVRRTGEVKLSPGEVFSTGEKAEFSLRVTGTDAEQAGAVIDDTLEGGTFSLLPFSVNNALRVFWASISTSVLSLLSMVGTAILEWLIKQKTG